MGYGGVTRGRCSSEEACFGLAAPGKESGGGVLLGLWWRRGAGEQQRHMGRLCGLVEGSPILLLVANRAHRRRRGFCLGISDLVGYGFFFFLERWWWLDRCRVDECGFCGLLMAGHSGFCLGVGL